jgi:hypothetical protein
MHVRYDEDGKKAGGDRQMSKSKQDKRWKVSMPIKVAIGLFGTICLVIAIVGSIVHG